MGDGGGMMMLLLLVMSWGKCVCNPEEGECTEVDHDFHGDCVCFQFDFCGGHLSIAFVGVRKKITTWNTHLASHETTTGSYDARPVGVSYVHQIFTFFIRGQGFIAT